MAVSSRSGNPSYNKVHAQLTFRWVRCVVCCKNMRVDLNNDINLHKLPESADLIFYLVIKQVEVSGDAAYS